MHAGRLASSPGVTWTAVAVVVALLSLPFGHALAFDPSAWVVWGREVWSLDLDTSAGPSWKPFPLLITAPAAILGDGAATAWLVVARAGAVLAVVGAARLAATVGGRAAGVLAATLVVVSPWWLVNGALGNADPILAALVVWAVLAAARGDVRSAFVLGTLGALIRPEVWPFLAVWALWQLRRGTLRPGPAVTAGVVVLAVWVVPDLLASGLDSTRGATGGASEGSAKNTAVPFLTVWADLGRIGGWVALAVSIAAVVGAAGLRDRWEGRAPVRDRPGPWGRWRTAAGAAAASPATWLGLALAYTLLVAAMTQWGGFAGNPRYLVPGLGLLAAAAGTVVVLVPGRRGGAGPAAVAAALAALAIGLGSSDLRDQGRLIDGRVAVRDGLQRAVDAAGGRERITACGPARSGPDLRTLVAEILDQSVTDAARRPATGAASVVPGPDAGRWRVTVPRCGR
ncbi:MAG: hypothetical protein AB7G37_05890 [Solirubrobacteraceae bacterium]